MPSRELLSYVNKQQHGRVLSLRNRIDSLLFRTVGQGRGRCVKVKLTRWQMWRIV